jgi:hypothetical protein
MTAWSSDVCPCLCKFVEMFGRYREGLSEVSVGEI